MRRWPIEVVENCEDIKLQNQYTGKRVEETRWEVILAYRARWGWNDIDLPIDLVEKMVRALPRLWKIPGDGEWVLRNFTCREIVLLQVMTKDDVGIYHLPPFPYHRVTVKGEPWLNLDRILLKRICWSGRNVAKGNWAEHSFDVVSMARYDFENGGGWNDSTKRIAEEEAEWY